MAKQRATFALQSGQAFRERGQLDQALQQLQVAVAADPNNAAVHRELAMVLQLQGKGADAAVERSKADALDPDGKTTIGGPSRMGLHRSAASDCVSYL